MGLTALQPQSEPKATPRSTEWCEIGQQGPWHRLFHKRMRYITALNRVSEQNSAVRVGVAVNRVRSVRRRAEIFGFFRSFLVIRTHLLQFLIRAAHGIE